MRLFEIIDGRRPKTAEPCGLLIYNKEKRDFRIQINRECSALEAPMLFAPFMEKGEYEIPPEWALVWVQERIVPPSRQNIGEVLEANGLAEYDELTLLISREGRCCQDEFMIREVQPITWSNTPSRFDYAYVDLEPEGSVQLKTSFGHLVCETRQSLGFNQALLAQRACIPQPKVSRIETGTANPTLETVAAIAKALGKQARIVLE